MATFERELKGHNGWVSSICFRNNILVSGSRDKNVIIWKESSPNVYDSILYILQGHEDYIQSVHLNSDSSLIASASWDKTVKIWEVKNGTEKTTLNHQSEVLCVKFTCDNLNLISSSKNNSIHVWDYKNNQKIFTFRTSSPPMKFDLTPITPIFFYAALENGQIARGSLDSKKIDLFLDNNNNNNNNNNDNNNTNNDNNKNIIKSGNGNSYFEKRLNTIAISPDGSLISAGGIDQKLVLFDVSNCQLNFLSEFKVQTTINETGYSPSRYWSIIIANKGIFIYDLELKSLVFYEESKSPSSVPISFAFSEDGLFMYVGYTDHSIRVWNFTANHFPSLEFPIPEEVTPWPNADVNDWSSPGDEGWPN